MSTVTPIHNVTTLPMDVVQAASLVGQVVTANDRQYTVHSVEGRKFYAFNQDGQVTIDTNMTDATWLGTPIVTLLPMGAKTGQGLSVVEMLPLVRRGVSLVKSWV